MKSELILIYDFDGTLTPFGMPRYPLLLKHGYDDVGYEHALNKLVEQENMHPYVAFCEAYVRILKAAGEKITEKTIASGAADTEFNKGVPGYFAALQKRRPARHFLLSSGFQPYLDALPVAAYFEGIFGTTFEYDEKGEYTGVRELITDRKKVDMIKGINEKLGREREDCRGILYLGDGLTDYYAMKFVRDCGGKSLYIEKPGESGENYRRLKAAGAADECFPGDYSEDGALFRYIAEY